MHIGGAAASSVDFTDVLGSRLPIFIGGVLGLSFLLLLLVFRSILVPLKAVLMNLLSIGAAYGVVVAIFQWGWGAGLFGVSKAPIEAWVPMMLFAIVFGLSMDYEVFLLERGARALRPHPRQRRRRRRRPREHRRVITAAALIMVFVFGSFVVSDLRALKLIGLGLAVAVAVDASDRSRRPRARDDGAARRRQLVVPALALPVHAPGSRRSRGDPRGRVRS